MEKLKKYFNKSKITTSNHLQPYYIDNSEKSWMVPIEESYLLSQVSYYGLNQFVSYFSHASNAIKGKDYDISDISENKLEKLIESCKILYGLLHSRFILTEEGISLMSAKFEKGIFGKCPRYGCTKQLLLPIGTSTTPGIDTVKTYCPKCHDVYDCDSKYDGAYFGNDFPLMFCRMLKIPNDLGYISFNKIIFEDKTLKNIPIIKQRLYRWLEINE